MPAPAMKYPSLLTLGAIIISLAFGYVRSRALVASGKVTEEERQGFTRGAALFWTLYCITQWGLQAASGYRDPLCFHAFPPHGLYAWASWLLGLVSVSFLLNWLWRDDNADVLARLAPAYLWPSIYRELPTQRVRLVVTILLIAGFGGGTLIRLIMPTPTCGPP